MASITASPSSDLNVLNITYTLTNEIFEEIKIHPFIDDGSSLSALDSGIVVLSKDNVNHGIDTTTGVHNTNFYIGNEYSGIYVLSIHTTTLSNTDSYTFANILLGKTLDCCIAEKTYATLDCDCDDAKCNENLADAQKMFLFKQSAEYVLRNIGPGVALDDIKRLASLTDAKNKYLKALELCSSGCGCKNTGSIASGTSVSSY